MRSTVGINHACLIFLHSCLNTRVTPTHNTFPIKVSIYDFFIKLIEIPILAKIGKLLNPIKPSFFCNLMSFALVPENQGLK